MTSKASGSELSRSRISLGFVGLVSFGIVFATSQAHTQQAPAGVRPAIEPTAAQPKKADQGDAPLTPQERAALPLSSGDYGEVERLWKAFLEAQHYREGENPGDVFISSGTAVVNFAKGRSGWIEARRNAFQVAELKSKASMIKFIDKVFLGQETFPCWKTQVSAKVRMKRFAFLLRPTGSFRRR